MGGISFEMQWSYIPPIWRNKDPLCRSFLLGYTGSKKVHKPSSPAMTWEGFHAEWDILKQSFSI